MALTLNPVLGRELKERMRGLKAFVALMIFLALLTVTVWLVYQANSQVDQFNFDLERQTRIGRELFEWVLSIMLLLLCFFIPGLTAGAVAGERERQTLLPLQITLLKPRQILWGKISAALAYLALLIVSSLPIFAVAYQLGGVSLLDGLRGIVCVLVIGVLLATMVVGISARAKRVQTATLLSYGFTFVFLFGTLILFGAIGIVDAARGNNEDSVNPPAIVAAANPLVFLADATSGENVQIGNTPLRPLRELIVRAYDENDGWFLGDDKVQFDNDGNQIFIDQGFNGDIVERRGFPAWVISLIWMSALALLLFWAGCRRLRTPAETER
jgi:ABC-type transport system involved in multi-copper enzyme maturation permease subunit